MKKVMLVNSPTPTKRGQYTFEDDGATNAGIYSSVNKFIKKDLYTFSENDSINQTIVGEGSYNFLADSYLKINKLKINNTGQGHSKKGVSVKIWMWVQRKSDFTTNYVNAHNIESRQAIWYKNYGKESSGWSPGTIINNATLLENFGEDAPNTEYNENWATEVQSGWNYINEVDNVSIGSGQYIGLRYLTEDPNDAIAIPPETNQKLYIAVKMTGDMDKTWFDDNLDDRWQFFEMDLNEVQQHPEGGVEFEFSANDNVHRFEQGGGSGHSAAAYIVHTLSVTIKRPTEVLAEGLPQNLVDILYAVSPPPRIEEYNYLLYYRLNPYNLIRWNDADSLLAERLLVEPNVLDNYNWRPVSIVKVNDIDPQAYYTDNDLNIKISSPTTIELSLGIGDDDILDKEQILNYDIYKKYGEDMESGDGKVSNIQYKFCVVDWNDKEDKILDFDYLYEFVWPITELEMLEKRRNEDTFNFKNVAWGGSGCTAIGCTNPDWQSGTLKHTYSEPGIKSVKLVVFSYCLNTDGFTIQAIEWKLVTIRFNLTKDLVYQDDFHEIGGADFKVLPWPYTTPIIGGVDTENSLYFNSIDKVFSEGKFLETDIIDEDMLLDSIENDELGSYTGDIDIEQVRLFNTGVYDMNTLLGIGDSLENLLLPQEAYMDFDIIPNSFPVIANDYNILTTLYDYNLDCSSHPKLENGKLDSTLFMKVELTNADWHPSTYIEITTGLNNIEGLFVREHEFIINQDTDNEGSWVVGENTITAWLGDVQYNSTDEDGDGYADTLAVDSYIYDYNFRRVQIYRTSDCTDEGASGNCIGSPDDTITIKEFRIIPNYPILESSCIKLRYSETGEGYPEEDITGCSYMEVLNDSGVWGTDSLYTCDTIFGPDDEHGGGRNRRVVCEDGIVYLVYEGPYADAVWPSGVGVSGNSLCGSDDYSNWFLFDTDCSSTVSIDSLNCMNPCPGGPLAGQCTGPTSGYAQCGCGGDSDGDGYGDSLPTALCDDGLLHCNCNLDPSTGEYYIYEDSWEYDIETIYVVTQCMTSIGTQYVSMISNGELIYATGDEACATLLTEEPEQTLQFTPYTKLDYWNGDQHQFPQESCVGTLFINDDMDNELRSKCLLELNTGTSDNTFIRDTSGNGNKGILIGDFKVKKESEFVSMTRDSLIIKPNTGTKDGAL